MNTLNLAKPEKSLIEYKITKYPDGQQDINITHNGYLLDIKKPVQILSRFNSFKDLELIICATKALRNLGIKEIELFIPYLLGARSDRQFILGGTSYLRDVVAPIINSLKFNSVLIIDPHSDVAEAVINNINPLYSGVGFIEWALNKIQSNNHLLVSPDGGSLKKIYKIAESIGYKEDIICCSKKRDENGKLSKTFVPVNTLNSQKEFIYKDKDFIIIDDICDGGRTFINIASEIKALLPESKIYLIVTHGIFSKGIGVLQPYFEVVYTTNSIEDLDCRPFVEQLNLF